MDYPFVFMHLLVVTVLLTTVHAQAPIPSQAQINFMNRGPLTMFQHFGPCTFADCQWDREPAPPSVFTPPDDMNTDQWFETASLMGASEVCLTVVRKQC
jgi:hypothetical protein